MRGLGFPSPRSSTHCVVPREVKSVSTTVTLSISSLSSAQEEENPARRPASESLSPPSRPILPKSGSGTWERQGGTVLHPATNENAHGTWCSGGVGGVKLMDYWGRIYHVSLLRARFSSFLFRMRCVAVFLVWDCRIGCAVRTLSHDITNVKGCSVSIRLPTTTQQFCFRQVWHLSSFVKSNLQPDSKGVINLMCD